MGGGSDSGGEQTTTSIPWPGVQGPLKNLYSTTQSALQNVQDYYPGQTYPNFTPLQEGGMYGNLDYAQNYYAPAATGYQQQLGKYMDAPLNVSQDPAVMAMMDANRTQATDWLTKDALPAITGGAVNAEQVGGSRQGIAEGLAMAEADKNLRLANAQTMMGAYGTASDLAKGAATLFPGAMQMGFVPGDLASQYGGLYQGLLGQGIDEAMNRYYYPEQSLWDKMATAGGIYSGAGNYGTSTLDGAGGGSSPIAGALGGAAMGAGLVPALGGTFGSAATATAPAVAASPWAWPLVAAGAIGGLI